MRRILVLTLLHGVALAQPLAHSSVNCVLRRLAAAGNLSDLHWPDFWNYRVHVHNFYEPTNYALAWTRSHTVTTQAAATIEILRGADSKGLNAEDYDGSRWEARLCRLRDRQPPSEEDLSRFDLALTVSVIRSRRQYYVPLKSPVVVKWTPMPGALGGGFNRHVSEPDAGDSFESWRPGATHLTAPIMAKEHNRSQTFYFVCFQSESGSEKQTVMCHSVVPDWGSFASLFLAWS